MIHDDDDCTFNSGEGNVLIAIYNLVMGAITVI